MHITVAICTHNRADMLHDSLETLLAMDRAADCTFDILVVDNNSTDATPEVARRYAAAHPDLISVFRETNVGVVHARNAAFRLARGDVIAFMDDDVLVDCDWLVNMAEFLRNNSDAACVAGRISGRYEGGRPDWLDSSPAWLNLEGLYSVTDYGEEDRELTFPEIPIGANMAIRRDVVDRIGGFATSLGRKGRSLLSKEESEFFFRAKQAGFKTRYASRARLVHRIPAERCNRKWILRRFYWEGISQVVFDRLTRGETRQSLKREILSDLRGLVTVVFGRSPSPLAVYWQVKRWRFWHLVFCVYTYARVRQRLVHLRQEPT